ncbi:MAG TPA: DNA repair protein RadC [Methylomirabilota bacterium]|nr:DNA repair protein RadC [Methylomirabilota bacterium]
MGGAGGGIGRWPAEDRPRERLYHKGPESLADAELLAIQLGTGLAGCSAMDMARELLGRYGSLSGLAGRGIAELAAVRGIGPVKAVRLAAAFEITRRLRSRNGQGRVVLGSPEQVFARYGPLMEDLKKEVFRVALLDAQNGLLRDVVISEGSLSASLVHPREVFKPAILESAASIILLHNHPRGDPTPSREDLRLTRQLVECADLLDLRIHDHVIIGHERFISLAQRGALAGPGRAS